MKIACFKKVSSLAVASALALGAAAYAPSAPAGYGCATWGCGSASVNAKASPDFAIIYGGSNDIKQTDHMCVYQRLRTIGQSWRGSPIPKTRACTATWRSYSSTASLPGGVRLYRDDGRYLTLWGPK
jgi:hypothetical protein